MSDKKPGFFKRLWGDIVGEQPAPPPEAPVNDVPPGEGAPAENVPPIEDAPPAPEKVETTSPTPDAEPDEVTSPGPPETTPDYVEEVEEQATAARLAQGVPEAVPVVPAPETAEGRRQNWLSRLSSGLRRSSDQLTTSITSVFTKRRLDDATLEELEDVLIQADLGLETAMAITETLRRDRFDRDVSGEDVRAVLASEVEKVLSPVARPLAVEGEHKPFVILMIGVNGSGKTTTIGKLAQKLSAEGKSVMLAAGDTFRAAAIEQLQVWGQRTGAPVVTRPAGADASGLAYDAVTEAKAAGTDVLIIDTAGRLQNRDELMNELEKVIRVIKKVDPTAPHATLLTLDATTGQNAMRQVEIFGQRAGVTGLVMTKLDGTARGGILVAIARKFGLPVHFIGVGEGVDDLEPFAAADFARAIAGRE
ncbi:signal recognition particle-docking protein FtsY [Devosia sp. RR2S18]|uniref:signal recognition particle-docking protein FtsY n=1 Tax=Devosia rhizosphaerae TaxID=3049774 RepID=UPI002541CEF7|nr:signal recognition particle-docking protein FtsY [Devosia sp. RR2S18]WIJ25512.1 signal recognition particle-docking protein FtsY [Devosia sp. RR2S18]